MTTLHDRLGDLADEAPSGAAPSDLWATGQRLHRRRQVGTAVIVAAMLAVLVGVGGLATWQARIHVEPAGTETPIGLPSQIYVVDSHLHGTDATGPIGPLSAVVPTSRAGWFGGGSNGVLGISTTGEYAFLDLPHSLADSQLVLPALSGDGRFVAYWRAGQPSGEPGIQTVAGEGLPVGVAVYDTVTGRSYEHLVETEHGLQPENLVWAGHRLWFDVWQMDAPRDDGGQSARRTEVLAWEPLDDDVKAVAASVSLDDASAWGDAILTSHRDRLRKSTPETSSIVGVLDTEVFDFVTPFLVSPGAEQVAVRRSTDSSAPILVGRLDPTGGRVRLTEVPDTREGAVDQLVGWRDEQTLVAYDYGSDNEGSFVTIDVATGERKILAYAEGPMPVVASGALAGPVFAAPGPPRVWDPRLLGVGALIVLLAGGLSLRWWRRRALR